MIKRRKRLPERRTAQSNRPVGTAARRLKEDHVPELIAKEGFDFDHELGWETPLRATSGRPRSLLLWITGAVFVLGLITAWALSVRKNEARNAPQAAESQASPSELGAALNTKIDRAHETIRSFLRASTIDGKQPFVRDSERVLPLMINWYSSHEHVSWEVSQFEMMATSTVNLKPFWISLVFVQDGPPITLMLEDTPDGHKVDWEAFVGYNPLSMSAFVDQKRQVPTDFRVYATASDYFLPPFDESQYFALKLECRNETTFVYGYLKHDDKDAAEIFALTRGAPRKPLQLALRFPIEATNRDTDPVEIVSLISNNWLGDKNDR